MVDELNRAYRSWTFTHKFDDKRKRKTESIWVATLDNKLNLINIYDIGFRNTPSSCYCYFSSIKELLEKDNTTKFILIHNHPSEDANPSNDDFFLTCSLEEYCKDNGFKLEDHLIFSPDDDFSFKAANILIASIQKTGLMGRDGRCKYLINEPNKIIPKAEDTIKECSSYRKERARKKMQVMLTYRG